MWPGWEPAGDLEIWLAHMRNIHPLQHQLWVDDYEEDGNTTLIMTQVQGQLLDRVLHRLSYQERERLSKDLKVFIHQIRCILNHTPFRFADTLGDALYDHRIEGEFRPFAEMLDFTLYWIPGHKPLETRNAITPVLLRPLQVIL